MGRSRADEVSSRRKEKARALTCRRYKSAVFDGRSARIYIWDFALQFIAVTLDKATCDNQPLQLAGLLELGHLKNRIDRFLSSGIDKTASVDDEHVRSLRIGSQLVPLTREQTHHHLAIDKVLGTTEADHSDVTRKQ